MSGAAWREAHREELRDKQRVWRAEHPDYQREWNKANAEHVREYRRDYVADHKDEINEKRRIRKGDRLAKRKEALAATAEERRLRRLVLIREWQQAHPDKMVRYRRFAHNRRVTIRGGEKIDRIAVYDRDGGVCGLCGEAVEFNDYDLDHIVPLSRGGEHTYANVQASHRTCNRRKHNRLASEAA